jgi:hypothetical protein
MTDRTWHAKPCVIMRSLILCHLSASGPGSASLSRRQAPTVTVFPAAADFT